MEVLLGLVAALTVLAVLSFFIMTCKIPLILREQQNTNELLKRLLDKE
jgi:hypothetical protein